MAVSAAQAVGPVPSLSRELRPVTARDLRRSSRGPILIGIVIIAIFFVGFGGWAATAPLASAALAVGIISPDGNRRTVQHLEGGIIASILVQDGSQVRAGDPLVLLEDIQARSNYQALVVEQQALLVARARLHAERTGADSITFPPEILAMENDPGVATLLTAQTELFITRREARQSRNAILNQRISQLEQEINGYQAQVRSQTIQLDLIQEEIDAVSHLVAQGLERRPRLLALQRGMADIAGERGSNEASMARARQAIGEAQLHILDLQTQHRDEVARQLNETEARLQVVVERLRAGADVLRRVVVTAPVTGTVVQLRYHTAGGVVGPGQPILDIVPAEDDLLIEARVSPADIDVVRPGLPTNIHLSAYRQRNLPRIEGTVQHVSADALVDQATGQHYFLAKIAVNRAHLHEIAPDVELMPGMPAEVQIMTGQRTMLEYMIDPLLASFRRSFRED